MNRSVLVSSLAALSFAFSVVACSDDPAASDAPAESSPVATTTPTPAPVVTAKPVEPPPSIVPPEEPAPVVAWNPSQVSDLSLWLNRKGLPSGKTKNVDITTWKDASHHHNDATSTAGSAPHSMLWGGIPGASFDGTQAMTIKDDESLQWKGDFTLVVIASSKQPATSGGILFSKSGVSAPYGGPALFANPGGPAEGAGGFHGQLDTFNVVPSQQGGFEDGAIHLLVLQRTAGTLVIRVDDTDPSSEIGDVGDTAAAGIDVLLGGNPGTGDGFVGDIFEVIAAPSQVDYEPIYDYFKIQYN